MPMPTHMSVLMPTPLPGDAYWGDFQANAMHGLGTLRFASGACFQVRPQGTDALALAHVYARPLPCPCLYPPPSP